MHWVAQSIFLRYSCKRKKEGREGKGKERRGVEEKEKKRERKKKKKKQQQKHNWNLTMWHIWGTQPDRKSTNNKVL